MAPAPRALAVRFAPTLALGLAVALAAPRTARAQSCAPDCINTNDYALDYSRGPVNGPTRAIGLSGAYTSLIDGLDGVTWNPAGYATRDQNSASFVRVDPVISGSYIASNDFHNSGTTSTPYSSFFNGQLGLGLQLGEFGVGDLFEAQTYVVRGSSSAINVTTEQNHLGAGWMFLRGQLVVGAAWRYSRATLQRTDASTVDLSSPTLVSYEGHSVEIGAAVRPADLPFRIGAAFRSEADAGHAPVQTYGGLMRAGNCNDAGTAQPCFVVPNTVVSPWSLDVGISLMLGPRTFNVLWENPLDDDEQAQQQTESQSRREREWMSRAPAGEPRATPQLGGAAGFSRRDQRGLERRHRYEARPRNYFLISVDLDVEGPVRNGQGVNEFLSQRARASGQSATFSPRFGIEAEPWSNRLKLRGGVYLEPSRYADVGARVHGTFGFDFRLFSFDLGETPVGVQVSAVFDGARDYYNGGFALGIWQ